MIFLMAMEATGLIGVFIPLIIDWECSAGRCPVYFKVDALRAKFTCLSGLF